MTTESGKLEEWSTEENATMSKPNGRQKKALEALAEALRPPPVEKLAAALTECFDAAVEAGTKHVDARLDKQDDTLRMIWRQCGGKQDEHLPIDD